MKLRKKYATRIVTKGAPTQEDIRLLKQIDARRRFMRVNETFVEANIISQNITAY